MGSTTILGISAYYHDAAACLVQDGNVIAAAEEERFNRKKHFAGFPECSIRFCLERAGRSLGELDAVVFYEKPFLKFERLLDTYLTQAPAGLPSFLAAMPVWMKEKLFLKQMLQRECQEAFRTKPRVLLFSEHHLSHSASAFFPSPFEEAAILCLDGVGEWCTTSAWLGENKNISPLWEIRFPHSLGLLYSAFTYHAGFKVNSGEYKLMGLAPYGRPLYKKQILEQLVDLKEDGTFRLNMDYFHYARGLTMTNEKFDRLFDAPARKPETPLTQREMDMARSIQEVTEEAVLRLGRSLHKETGKKNLCLAGGVALNCVANGRLLREGPFESIWVQPAAGDSGGALGAALAAWHGHFSGERKPKVAGGMKGACLGPAFSNEEIRSFLLGKNIPFHELEDTKLLPLVAADLAEKKVVGWFSGAMEFGPRALGARSILADARGEGMQEIINLKIKKRESFRPFAPAILEEHAQEYFELEQKSPYMLFTVPVKKARRKEVPSGLQGLDLLKAPHSDIPAVTHVDYSARVQTVGREAPPRFRLLLENFFALTGSPLLVNTSFNLRGEPIVCSPADAYLCFRRAGIDTLVLENFLLRLDEQPPLSQEEAAYHETD